MDAPFPLPVTTAGMLVAVAAVVGGGPLFAAGLAALRGRRVLRELRPSRLAPDSAGTSLVCGSVQLESPLFAPLSQRACAGFVLEVASPGAPVSGRILDRRSFRIVGDGVEAHVAAEQAAWIPEVSDERVVEPGEALPTRLEHLIDSLPEARWLRTRGPVRLIERALLPSAEVWVAGFVRRARPAEAAVERVLAATGTDDATAILIGGAGHAEPALWIEAADEVPLTVSGLALDPSAMAPPAWKLALVVAGPVLSLSGLLHLAQALDHAVGGRF